MSVFLLFILVSYAAADPWQAAKEQLNSLESLLIGVINKAADNPDDPDITFLVPDIVKRHGYPCETHTVRSQGYVLNVHRIPYSKNSAVSSKTVLLQHGVFGSSADWLLNGPGKALAYVLADAGYDVWMSNVRGNRYSRNHLWLDTNSQQYWDFSWHESAQYDLPVIIDYIKEVKGTGAKITYIGHSMGSTILLAMLSLRPEYNNILTHGIALAPEIFFTDLKSPFKYYANTFIDVKSLETLLSSYEINFKNGKLAFFLSLLGFNTIDGRGIFKKEVIFHFCGSNEKQLNQSLIPKFAAHFGTGTSMKTLSHFAQELLSGGQFQQFDHGMNDNVRIYGNFKPPKYDLSRISLPLTLFWSTNDLLSSETDVGLLYDMLPHKPETYLVQDPQFNHLDYLWAIDADILINRKILQILARVN